MTKSDSELLHMVQTVVDFFSEEKFDGVVLEIWRQFGGQVSFVFTVTTVVIVFIIIIVSN